MLCAKFGWNWPSGSGEEDFQIYSIENINSLLSPLVKGKCPSFEQTLIPSTQGCFVPSLVEIGSVILEMKILKNAVKVVSLFRNHLPSEMGGDLDLNKFESSSSKNALC